MKREDGRKPEELRPLVIKAGVIGQANGSALVEMGRTKAVAAVYGPELMEPRHRRLLDRGVLKTVYSMTPFSTTDRCRPGPSRRSREISKVVRGALESVVFLEDLKKMEIGVYIDIIQADAGTRTAAINAASVALADAGIPMRDLVASVAIGKIGNDYMVDLGYKEEELTLCDLPIAYIPRMKQISLLQMDGDVPIKDVKEIISLGVKICEKIYAKQKEALKERWMK